MISDRCLEELGSIMEIDGITRSEGANARKKALSDWISAWTTQVTVEQSILDREFTSEEEDYIKYHLATQVSERLIELCADIKREKTKITLKMRAFLRKRA